MASGIKKNRGGRAASAVASQATPQPAAAPAPTIGPTPTAAMNMPRNYSIMSDQQAQQLRDDVDDKYDIDTVLALKQYVSKKDTGNGYSMSQNLNWKVENNKPLTANEQYMLQQIQGAMHPIGQDTILIRGAHADTAAALGLSDWSNIKTDAQLQAKLKGATFTNKSLMSASYDVNKNPFLNGPVSGGREVVLRIKADSNTQMVFGAKSQAETILGIGQNWRVTGARFTGSKATPRNSTKVYRQIEIEIERY